MGSLALQLQSLKTEELIQSWTVDWALATRQNVLYNRKHLVFTRFPPVVCNCRQYDVLFNYPSYSMSVTTACCHSQNDASRSCKCFSLNYIWAVAQSFSLIVACISLETLANCNDFLHCSYSYSESALQKMLVFGNIHNMWMAIRITYHYISSAKSSGLWSKVS